MQAKPARGSSTTQVVKRFSSGHQATFTKVVDGRKQPIRGLRVRNQRYYAQITV
jgi:hypothetical protein